AREPHHARGRARARRHRPGARPDAGAAGARLVPARPARDLGADRRLERTAARGERGGAAGARAQRRRARAHRAPRRRDRHQHLAPLERGGRRAARGPGGGLMAGSLADGTPLAPPPGARAGAWRALEEHRRRIERVRVAELFAGDPGRFERLSFEVAGLLVDLSKHRVTDETLELLTALARAAGVEALRDAMFAGAPINLSEGRAVMHVALRNRSARPMLVDGQDVMPQVRAVLEQMRRFSDAGRAGGWRGFTGERVTDVVTIGIGGSHLGAQMAVRALRPYADGPRVRFVSNVDGAAIHDALRDLDPATTLFLIASKTFTTLETMTNRSEEHTSELQSRENIVIRLLLE